VDGFDQDEAESKRDEEPKFCVVFSHRSAIRLKRLSASKTRTGSPSLCRLPAAPDVYGDAAVTMAAMLAIIIAVMMMIPGPQNRHRAHSRCRRRPKAVLAELLVAVIDVPVQSAKSQTGSTAKCPWPLGKRTTWTGSWQATSDDELIEPPPDRTR
jgi:hypothetical protein